MAISRNRTRGWKWRIKEVKKEGKKEVEKMNEEHISVHCVWRILAARIDARLVCIHTHRGC